MSKRPLNPSSVLNALDEAEAATPSKLARHSSLSTSLVDTTRPCFAQLLAECGVVMTSLDDESATDSAAQNPLAVGFEISVSVAALHSSITAMLKSLHATPNVDFDEVITQDLTNMVEDDDMLLRMLSPMRLLGAAPNASSLPSLVKLLLRNEFLQSSLLMSLLEKLPACTAENKQSVRVAKRVVSCIRWMDNIYDTGES
jgi:hypothetical protein